MRVYWADIPAERNTELCFVCRMPQAKAATLSLVAKDIYNLYINGRFVQYGPARAAKGYVRVEKIALDGYLTEEENRICVYVQSNATKFLHLAEEPPLFGAELAVGGKIEKTAADFRCYEMTDKLRKTEKLSAQRGFAEVYRMTADREKALESFPLRALREVPCPELLPRGVAVSRHEKVLAERYDCGLAFSDETKTWHNPFTNFLDNDPYGYKRTECECRLCEELVRLTQCEKADESGALSYLAYALPRVRCGKFSLRLTAKENCDIWLVYDDILVDGKVRFNRAQVMQGMKWSLEKGVYTLYSQEVYSAQYITLFVRGQVCVEEVSVLCAENPETAYFAYESADKDVQKILNAAKHSFEQNAYDIFTDCPSRERAGWLCDSYFMGEAESLLTGGHKVERNFLENYLLYRNDGYFAHDGVLPMCYPSEPKGENDYIPNWILWYLLELERYLARTGDKAFIARHKQRAYAILDFFRGYENEYGLLENLGGWVFVEWSKANDCTNGVNFPSNMLYAAAIAAVGNCFSDGALLRKAETLKKNIRALSYRDGLFVDNAVRADGQLRLTDNTSETCQNYACFFGVLTARENPDFYERFFRRFGALENPERVYPSNMFMGYVLRLMVLSREGRYAQVLHECKQAFLGMAERTGTLWELFAENASCNHGFGSIVAKLLVEAEQGLKEQKEC